MTVTDAPETIAEQPALEAGPIPTSTVEVDGLGTVDESMLDGLTKDWLKKVIRALDSAPPRSATPDELRKIIRNGLRLRAMEAAAEAAGAETTELVDAGENPDVANALVPMTDEEKGLIPSSSQFQQIVAMAEYLARSNLTPEHLRGRPNDVGAVLLRAWDLGISQSAALESLYVVHGKVGMEGKLMSALIRRAGHSLRVVESDERHAVWYGRRADGAFDEGYGEFSLDDALQAGLIDSINQDGTVKPLRDKPTWQKYTRTMLKWRALAVLARDLFSDCIAGVSYLPEELGYIDVEEVGAKAAAGGPEPTITLNQQRSALAARIAELPEDLRAELREAWKARNLPRPDDLRPGAIRTATGLIEEAEKVARERQAQNDETIDEAELVDENAGDGGDGQGGTDAAAPAADEPAPGESSDEPEPDELTEFCGGCGEAIADDVNPVYDDEEKPWHPECATWL